MDINVDVSERGQKLKQHQKEGKRHQKEGKQHQKEGKIIFKT